jgi:hypothetical protein
MTSKYLLVISKDYWGTQTSENTAEKFSKEFSNSIGILSDNITKIIGKDVYLKNVKDTIYSFIYKSLLDNPIEPRLYIYINGHGNQITDNNHDELDGQDELYQLPDGNLLDDELTEIIDKAVFNSNVVNRPVICLISDHCSSGSMIDKTQKYFDWITIGSSLDNQDSFVSGDGNVMTCCLLNVLNTHKNILNELTASEFFMLLSTEMKESFIGDLQICTMHMSSDGLSNIKLFL